MNRPKALAQLVSFATVGIAATVTHVAIAWMAFEAAGLRPIAANLLGAVAAFFVSFLCNATMTFQSRRSLTKTGPRYLVVSLVSYVLATGIMLFVESRGLPMYVFALAVVAIVPPTTFLLAKFWVFSPRYEKVCDEPEKTRCV